MTLDDLRRDVELAGRESFVRYSRRVSVATQFVGLGGLLVVVGFMWYLGSAEGMVVPLEPNGVAIQSPADPVGLLAGPVLSVFGVMLVTLGLSVYHTARRRFELVVEDAIFEREQATGIPFEVGEWFEEARHV